MSVWKKQSSRDANASLRAIFPSMNLSALDVCYNPTVYDIKTRMETTRAAHLQFEKQLARKRTRSKKSSQQDEEEDAQRKIQEEHSYDAMIRAKDYHAAPPMPTKATHASRVSSQKMAARGLQSFASVPARERHYLTKFDGPVGLKNTAQIDYYSKVDFEYKRDPNKDHALDFAKQTKRKQKKLAESAALTYDIKFPRDHVSAVPMDRVAKRSKRVYHMLQNEQEGDPGKYLPSVAWDSKKGQRPKLVANFAHTDRTHVKHLHPRVQISDLSYNVPSDFDLSPNRRRGAPDIFLTSSRKADSKKNVVKSVDWLLGCLDRELKSMRRGDVQRPETTE